MAFASFLLAVDPPEISFGTYHEHKIGLADLRFTPGGPAFRRGLDVLIDAGVYALSAQPFGQSENLIGVRLAVVAVADKDPWWRPFWQNAAPSRSAAPGKRRSCSVDGNGILARRARQCPARPPRSAH